MWLYEGCGVGHRALVFKAVSSRNIKPYRCYVPLICRLCSR